LKKILWEVEKELVLTTKKKKKKETFTNAQPATTLEAHSREASPFPNFDNGPRLEEFSTTQPV
jgi:hypothetical protein